MTRPTSIRQGLLRSLLLIIVLVGGGIIAVSLYAARHMLESLAREVIGHNLTVTEVELQRFFGPVEAALRTAADWGNRGLLDDDRPEKLNPLFQPLEAGDHLKNAVTTLPGLNAARAKVAPIFHRGNMIGDVPFRTTGAEEIGMQRMRASAVNRVVCR